MRIKPFFVGQRFYLCPGFSHKRATHSVKNVASEFLFDIHTLVGYKALI